MARYVPGLEIYGFTNGFTLVPAPPFIPPHGTFPIAVSYSWRQFFWEFQPHQTLPQALLLLAVTTTTKQQPRRRHWQQGFGVLCQDTSSTLGSPSLSPLLPADPCVLLVFGFKELERWACSKTKLFFFLNYVTGVGFGFFSDLLYLWVECCDSVPVSSQCYNFCAGGSSISLEFFTSTQPSLLNVWELDPISITEPMPEGCPELIATDRVTALPKPCR